jgi:glutamate N-acetyltransferase/amino-acid N-acetyltransferase
LDQAARAILTTDTKTKVSSRLVAVAGHEYRLTGFAKGAAMIGPNLATMLAFVITDAPIAPHPLQKIAHEAAAETFNCISVEGHTSTNDSLLFFANGAHPGLQDAHLAAFRRSAFEVCGDLARAISADAEGATRLIRIKVMGLRTDQEARKIAKTVAESALVKTAVYGADPNWGRIVSAAGYAGVDFQERDLSLRLGPFLLYDAGVPQAIDGAAAARYLKENREIDVALSFHLGNGRCMFWTSDLTHDYVTLNAEYTT